MAQAIAKVVFVSGDVFAKDKAGNTRRLQAGDTLNEGEVVVTGKGANVQLAFEDGRDMVLRANETMRIDAEVAAEVKPGKTEAAVSNVDQGIEKIVQALNEGGDLDAVLEDPAAGVAGGGEEGHSFVRLLRIAEGVDGLSFNFNSAQNVQPPEFQGGEQTPPTTNTNTGSTPDGDTSVLAADIHTVSEDSPATGNVLANDSDVDNVLTVATFTVTGVAGTFNAGQTANIAGVGTLTIAANGDYTFTPVANWNGAVPQASYTTNTGSSSTLDITVTPVNDPSVLVADTNTVAEDNPATGNVLANDSDVDNALTVATFTVTGVAGTFNAGQTANIAGVGTLTIAANGDYTFTPVANWNGTVPQASYTTNTGSTSTLDITVTPVNDPSVLVADTNTVAEDNPATGNVLTNDSDVDSALTVATFTVTGVAGTFNAGQTANIAGVGTLTIATNGDYTFTPVANWNGTVPQASYVTNTGSSSTLDITVTPVNDPSVLVADTNTVAEDNPATGNVLSNDSDVDNALTVATFTVTGVAGTFNAGQTANIAGVGSLTIAANGDYTFTPVANWNGTVPQASYTTNTGSTSTLDIAVTPVNDPSVLVADTNTVAEDNPATGNVLTNDSDVDNALTVATFTVTGVAGTFNAGQTANIAGIGTLTIAANGDYTFTPVANWNGTVPQASYTTNTGSSSTLDITVTPVNDASVLVADTNTVAEDNPATGNVLTNDSDVDNALTVSTFTVTGVAGTFNAGQTANIAGVGTLTIAANGDYTFTPVANWNGTVPQASYTTNTGSSSTLDITVTPANDPSVLVADTNTVAEDNPATGNVLANDSDVDNALTVATFTVTGVAGTFNAGQTANIAGVGTLTIAANGDYTFTPVANWNGNVPQASYTTNTGSTSTLDVTVTPVNDPSVLVADTNTVTEDNPATGNVLTNDSDVDNALTVATFAVTGIAGTFNAGQTANIAGVGTLTIAANGDYTFTPVANWNGTVPQASYTTNTGSTSTLDITVTPVNDPSVLVADTNTVAEDNPATGNVLTNDSDVDNALTVATFTVTGVAGTFNAGQTANIAGVGTLTIAANGDYTFTPVANWNGTVPQAAYTTNTGSTSTLDITVTPVNDPSVLVADTNTVAEDNPATGNVLANDSDVDNALTVATFTVSGVAGTFNAGQTANIAGVGTLTIAANGDYTFTPVANWNGTVPQASYTTNTGSTSTLDITVTPVDDTPTFTPGSGTIGDDAGEVTEDATLVANGVLAITDPDAGESGFQAQAGTPGNYGSFTINAAGNWSYTLNNGLPAVQALNNGETLTDTLNVLSIDGTPTTVTITIHGTSEGVPTITIPDSNGAAAGNASIVEAAAAITGSVTLSAPDGLVSASIGGTTLTLAQLNALSGSPVAIPTGEGTLTLTGFDAATGQLDYSYSAPAQTSATDVLDNIPVSLIDSASNTASTTLGILILDTAPTATGDSAAVQEDGTLTAIGNVIGNDTLGADATNVSAINGNPANVGNSTAGSYGSLTLAANGAYTYTLSNANPAVQALAAGQTVNDVFSYTLTDADGDTSTVNLTVTITGSNDGPTAVADSNSGPEDNPITGNVLTNDSDVDTGASLTVTQYEVDGSTYAAGVPAVLAGVGTLVINSNGSYSFTPLANYNGPVPVATYTVSDGIATTTSTLTLNVTPVDDASVLAADTNTVAEDNPATGNVLTNDSDVDNALTVATFTVTGVAGTFNAGQTANIAGVGTLTIAANGDYTFTPVANWNGNVPQASYTTNTGSTSTLDITVTPVNDPSVLVADTNTVAEDNPATGNVLTNDSDVDNALTVATFTVTGVAGTFNAGQTANIAGIGTLTIAANGDYTFTPNANWNGTVPQASYTTNTGSSSTLDITVTPVNDPSVLVADTNTVAEDNPATGNVLTNDSDVDNALTVVTFTVTGVAGTFNAGQTANIAGVGTLTIAANGDYTFTPVANWNGTVPQASYTTNTGSTSTLDITVTPDNDPSVLVADTNTVAEDNPATGNVLTNDSDVDNALTVATFTVTGVAGTFNAGQTANIAGIGTLTIAANGDYTFTPVANWNGTVPQASYTTNTGSSSTLDITVTPVNDPSVLVADTNTVAEDNPATGNVLTNDSDVDNALTVATFTITGVAGTFNAGQTANIAGVGTLTIAANGDYTFTPVANWNGSVPQASYTTNTGSSSTLDITVTPVNDPSVLVADTNTVAEDNPATGNVLTNDSDVDNALTVETFTVTGVAGTFNVGQTANIAGVGTLTIAANGDYTFTPVANWNGTVPQASYVTNTGSTSTLDITVTPVNDPSVLVADTNTVAEDNPATGNVLTNDNDVDNALTVATFTVTSVAGTFNAGQTANIAGVGTLTIAANGDYTFTPVANWNGTVPQASYTTNTGSTSTLDITVTPVNDPSVLVADTNTVAEDNPATGNVLTNDSDVDNALTVATFTITGVAGTFNAGQTANISGVGTLTIAANGDYTFTPVANWNGTVPQASYVTNTGSTSTLDITVTPVNDPSVLVADTNTVAEDNLATGNVLTNDSDVDNVLTVATFTVTGIAGTFNAGQTANIAGVGTLTIAANGDYTFTPVANWNGTVPQASYTTNTGSNSTLDITVTPVNDPSVLVADTNTVAEDNPATGNVLSNDSDVDNALTVATFTVTGVAGTFNAGQTANIAGVGTLTIAANGDYTFTPVANWNGTVPQASYTTNTGSSSTLDITVTPVNDASVLVADTNTVAEDNPATGNVLTNDSDVDNALTVATFTVTGVAGTFNAGQTANIAGVGTLTIAANGDYTFTPVANWNGTVPQASYVTNTGSTSTLDITVTPVNDPSVLVADTNTVAEDNPATGNVLTNDSDVDNALTVATFTVTGIAGTFNAGQTANIAGVGTLTIAANGDYTFTPVANWNGTVPQASYTTNTGFSSTLDITVTPVDDASILVADTNTVAEDNPATGNVLSNDSDIDNALSVATFTVAGVAGTFNAGQTANIAGVGTLTIATNGDYTFTPVANWNGTVPQAAYTTNTGSTSTLDITVTPVNDPSVLVADSNTVAEDNPATGNVLTNDSDVDNALTVATFTVTGVAGAFNAGQTANIAGIGTLTIAANGDYTFTPVANWNGAVPQASYTTNTGSTSTLDIIVTPVNDPSVLVADTNTVAEDNPATGNVLANDSDVDNALTVSTFTVTGIAGTFNAGQTANIAGVGTLSIAANGDYTFTPVANWNGSVPQASYTTNTGSSSTLNITVTPVNDPSVLVADTNTVAEDNPATGNVLTNDSDVDNALTVATFTVTGVAGTFNAGQTANIAGVGTLTIAANGDYTFTPVANWNGTVPQASYVTNTGSNSTLDITVTPVNDPSVLVADTNTVAEDNPATGNVLTNDSDVDNALNVATFTVTGVAGAFNAGQTANIAGVGTLTIAANGDYTFTPVANWNGAVPQASYTTNTGSSSTLNITVTPVNDAPVMVSTPQNVAVSEEGLAGGMADTSGSPDTTNASTASGQIVVTDIDSASLTFTLSAPAGAYTSGGAAVSWSLSPNGQTLTGSAGGNTVLQATIDNNGNYNVSLLGAFDHPTGGGENALSQSLQIGVSATDGSNAVASSITVTVEDDAPLVADQTRLFQSATADTNIMLVLDRSYSMTELAGGQTKLALMKQAALNLLDQYDGMGDVKVAVVTFAGAAAATQAGATWMTVAEAKVAINAITAVGLFDAANYGTDYDAALAGAQTAFALNGKIADAENVSYFLTDGKPWGSNPALPPSMAPTGGGNTTPGIDAGEEAAWVNFLTNNQINSYAYGFSADPTLADLQPIAYNGKLGVENNAVVVTDPTNLPSVLAASVPIIGNLVTHEDSGFGFGADGGSVQSLVVDGRTFNYAGTIAGTGDSSGTYNASSHVWTITTGHGGVLVIDLDDGSYTYAAPSGLAAAFNEVIAYNLSDRDGDTGAAVLTIDVRPNFAPVATNDTFLTQLGTPLLITTAQLVSNDVLADGATITSVSALAGAGTLVNNGNGTWTFTPSAAGNASFTYTLTDSDGQTSTATVGITTYTAGTDLATVYESALTNGTGGGNRIASGNLFANDGGGSSISNINGVTDGSFNDTDSRAGYIGITNAQGTLVVDTSGTGAGDFVYTLNAPANNSAPANNNSITQNFSYTSNLTTSSLQVTIVDDRPQAYNRVVEVSEDGLPSYNLVLTLDVSGSMTADGSGGGVRLVNEDGSVTITNRLAMAKQAMVALVEEYFSQAQNVSVKLVTFASSATILNSNVAYTNKEAAIAAINAISGSGGTDYTAALDAVQTAFGTVDPSVQNISYFISDGDPTEQDTVAPASSTGFSNFVTTNDIRSYAVGIGSGISNTGPLNGIHNVDADHSGSKDAAIMVPDLNALENALLNTVPVANGGNVVGGAGGVGSALGADDGWVQHITLSLDTNGNGLPDTNVTFNYNQATNQISWTGGFPAGSPQSGDTLTLNSAKGFVFGTLVFNFQNGEYSYFSNGVANEGDTFRLTFVAQDGDGDVTPATTLDFNVVDGQPIARPDVDTLFANETAFAGNVISGMGTDGGLAVGSLATDFSAAGSGVDKIVDDAEVSSITFQGQVFDLTTNSSGSALGGNYTINNGQLSWSHASNGSALVFNSDGYYNYTPTAANTPQTPSGAINTVTLTGASQSTATSITVGDLTFTGMSRISSAETAGVLRNSTNGIGVSGGSNNGRIDNLETLVITFNRTNHPNGVENVTIDPYNANSNLGGAVALTYSIYHIDGHLLGQCYSSSEGAVAMPSEYSNIGRIEVMANSNAYASIGAVTFRSVQTGAAAEIAPVEIGYTVTDSDGDASSSTLTLRAISNTLMGDDNANTINGTNSNDYLNGGAGNDTLSGGLGHDLLVGEEGNDNLAGNAGDDVLRGGAGNDTLAGGTGKDVLSGGFGNDLLIGGADSDIFQWSLSDKGAAGSPATDTVQDFSTLAAAAGGDVLDLRDLLQGESHLGNAAGNLTNFLHFEVTGGANTTIHVSSGGGFTSGFNVGAVDQTIVLEGVDLTSAGSMSDTQIIQNLLSNGKLLTD